MWLSVFWEWGLMDWWLVKGQFFVGVWELQEKIVWLTEKFEIYSKIL